MTVNVFSSSIISATISSEPLELPVDAESVIRPKSSEYVIAPETIATSSKTAWEGVIIDQALPFQTRKSSLLLLNHKSPSCSEVPSALCVGALPAIWYKSAK